MTVGCHKCWHQYQPDLWWLGVIQVKVDDGQS